MKHRLIHSSILVLLVSASASAEQVIKAQVPFPFHIGVSVMSSGSYTVDSRVASEILRFTSADRKSSAMILFHASQSGLTRTQPKLVFNKYGNEYFLYQVWAGDGNRGHELLKSRAEKEIAATVKRSTTTLVATK
jgi:hypothetical protein